MTINEFKAFLEGMDVQGAPTTAQWQRIKEKLDELSGEVQFIPQLSTPGYNPLYPDSVNVPTLPYPYITSNNGTHVFSASGQDLGPSD